MSILQSRIPLDMPKRSKQFTTGMYNHHSRLLEPPRPYFKDLFAARRVSTSRTFLYLANFVVLSFIRNLSRMNWSSNGGCKEVANVQLVFLNEHELLELAT